MRFDGGLGVKAVSTWIPTTTEKAADVARAGRIDQETVERLGVHELPVSGRLAPPEMAVRAARKALARAGWEPERVGMLVHAWVYHQGYDKWAAPHYIANQLGLRPEALPVGIHELCNGGTTALYMAAANLVADERLPGALVTTADRYGAPVWDRWLTHTDIGYGDGATAALLHRRDGSDDALVLLSLTHSSASLLEGLERGDAAFTRAPLAGRDNLNSGVQRRQFYDRYGKESLGEAARRNVRATLEQALDEAGLAADDPRIRYVLVPRVSPRLTELMYAGVVASDLKAELVWLGAHTGHLGAGDMPANMADLVERRMLRPGEFAVVAGAGGGFTWATAIVQAPGR
ncbi:3-oxoacyl-[acyl-carrier-protein] synthase 3 [Paractinoplanes deccanensis]|uniref:3-oxoacyl-[acyl-carrier-protein] synthase 3 n=1 Tax=Paractinoplanes deccanensis TaxID=113561 RepID=A0ABQ3XYH3_9ACTN|nr:3-oxoacyl-[acyl-carrier-protein] synthase III C-terminal domain-containing protein [Actinoplanes deccanensis]GID72690.1 3-oxoacyl-[acyl-carrier-protein] synthase 3 [Actinoplanes deccanensis]